MSEKHTVPKADFDAKKELLKPVKPKEICVTDQSVQQTCCIDDAICTDGSMRSLDVPLAVSGWVEAGDWGWVVDLGTVHTSTGSQSHGQRVRVNVAIVWCIQTRQHLKNIE